ncbi:MAG TPA: manganese efflux pump MntP family protein [Spirochaetales bacterium]|nr:manganese efflux pump MntP family protein [Spirochaetales bacterium]
MLTYLLVALGLSMDAFAVSVSSGICIPHMKARHALRAAFAFGLFQFLMPVAGWLAGSAFRAYIQGLDHWIAFALLALVGGKMLKESFELEEESACADPAPAAAAAGSVGPGAATSVGPGGAEAAKPKAAKRSILDLGGLLVLAVATSLDALAVGLSYSMLGTPILGPAAIIGLVTFGLCLFGCEFGKRIGAKFERWAEVAGGVVLIGIGIKILAEHLVKAV